MKSTIRTAPAFSGAIQFLIEKLRAIGSTQDADRIAACQAGPHTTSSETYGELALALDDIRVRHGGEVRRLIDDCRAFAANHRKILGLK